MSRSSNFDLSNLSIAPAESQSETTPPKADTTHAEAPPKSASKPRQKTKNAKVSGFRGRRNAAPLRRQVLAGRPRGEERHQFNVRMLPKDAAAFIEMAEEEGMTYGDLVATMIERIKRVGLHEADD